MVIYKKWVWVFNTWSLFEGGLYSEMVFIRRWSVLREVSGIGWTVLLIYSNLQTVDTLEHTLLISDPMQTTPKPFYDIESLAAQSLVCIPNLPLPPSLSTALTPFMELSTGWIQPITPSDRMSKDKDKYCKFCGKYWQTSGHLRRHMRVHTGEKPFKCNVCGKTFRQNVHLAGHMIVHLKWSPNQVPD